MAYIWDAQLEGVGKALRPYGGLGSLLGCWAIGLLWTLCWQTRMPSLSNFCPPEQSLGINLEFYHFRGSWELLEQESGTIVEE